MASDTADDEKAVKPEGAHPTDQLPASDATPTPSHDASAARGPDTNPSLEWTASDSRGPLVTAEERHRASAVEDDGMKPVDATSEPTSPIEPTHPAASETNTAPTATEEAPVKDTAPVRAPQDLPPESKKRSLLPIAAALIVGAIIGAGSAAIVYNSAGGTTAEDPHIASLSSRLDALEKRPSAQTAVDGLKGTVADLSQKVTALQSRAPSAAPSAATPQAVDLSPLQKKLAALQADLDALKAKSGDTSSLQTKIAALEAEVAGAKTASSSNQAGLESVAGQQKLLASKVMVPALAVVADSLVAQIDQGEPYGAQVDALVALGADPAKIAILRQYADKGVPSAKMLAAKFEPLAEPIIATAHKAPPNAGFVDRLKSGMFSMVSVRSADDTSGTDLPSRVARIEMDLAHDDVADALATWDALPPEAKAKGDAWGALAKTSAETMTAARALQHDAITALGAKKS